MSTDPLSCLTELRGVRIPNVSLENLSLTISIRCEHDEASIGSETWVRMCVLRRENFDRPIVIGTVIGVPVIPRTAGLRAAEK